MDFQNLSLIALSDAIRNGNTTREAVYQYFLERTKTYNPALNAFNTLPVDMPVYTDGPLAGLPIAVKDVFCEK